MTLKRGLFALFTAAVIAAMVGILVVPAAYNERCYWAIGGEWLLVVMSFVSSLWFLWEEK